jgi:hypothetical protein
MGCVKKHPRTEQKIRNAVSDDARTQAFGPQQQ